MSLVSYRDSESESDNENGKESQFPMKNRPESTHQMRKRRKLTAPPLKLVHKFSKTPLKVNKVNVRSIKKREVAQTLETTFVYLPIIPTENFISEVDKLITELQVKAPVKINSIENLCINKLTKTLSTLHISLSYNITLSREELDKFVEDLRSHILREMEFPLNIGFSKTVEILSNNGKSKCFISLKLDKDSIEKLRPLVTQINGLLVGQRRYDADALHVSVAAVAGEEVAGGQFAAIPKLQVAVQRVELSRGRSVAVLSRQSGEQ